ncbi:MULTISPECIES: acyl carrier protein [Mycobacteroides]|uniref:acyl carrier protein n=1 Tax=Mycobacteroides TaxID=670516 RepID=UPI001064F1B1|nr:MULTISPECIES: acyl carrier protein [Mycobacteroides]QQG98782.1 acyl carrier protein [Mycobacteroides chelonae]TDZ98787.1 Acyl carrier protein MbtL [Mycobacteroides salmoniphilum]
MDLSSAGSVGAELIAILHNELRLDTSHVTSDSRLVDDVGLDSVTFFIGLLAIEDKLGVELSEREILSAQTVGDLVRTIAAKIPDKEPNT